MSPQGWQDDNDGNANKLGDVATVQVNNLIPGGGVVADATGTLQLGTPNAIGNPGGVAGADGEAGDQGPPGVAGVAGAAGSTGAPGPASVPLWVDGEDGQDGLPGPAGQPGTPGTAGPAGAPGPTSVPLVANDGEDGQDAWIPGPTGATGPIGAPGPSTVPLWTDGEDGQDALTIPGAIGATGSTGAPGPVSVPLWTDGEDGQDAMTIPGAVGAAGSAGAPGPASAPLWGQDGEDGTDAFVRGPTGQTGGSGAPGSAGAPGATGLFIWGNDGEDGGDAFVRGANGQQGGTGAIGPPGASGPPVFAGSDGEDGVDGGARTPVYPSSPQILVSGGANSNPVGDPNFVYSGGKLSVGQATFDAIQHTVLANDTTPNTIAAWDTRHAAFGVSGSTGAGVGISRTASTSTTNVSAVSPNVAWENLRLQALTFALYSSGATLGAHQDSSGNFFIALALQLTALAGNAGFLLKVDGSGNVGVVSPVLVAPSFFKWSINFSSSAGVLSNSQSVIVPGDSGSITTGAGIYNAAAGTSVPTTMVANLATPGGPTIYTVPRAYTAGNFSVVQLNCAVAVANGANIQYSLYVTTNAASAVAYSLIAFIQTGALTIGSNLFASSQSFAAATIPSGAFFLVTAHRIDVAGTSIVSTLQFTVNVEFDV